VVPENVPTLEGFTPYSKGEVVSKAKTFKLKYEPNWNFQKVGRFKPKIPTKGGVWISSETICTLNSYTCIKFYVNGIY